MILIPVYVRTLEENNPLYGSARGVRTVQCAAIRGSIIVTQNRLVLAR